MGAMMPSKRLLSVSKLAFTVLAVISFGTNKPSDGLLAMIIVLLLDIRDMRLGDDQ